MLKMDASDHTRLRKARAWYIAQDAALQIAQSTSSYSPGTSTITFLSYDAKYNYYIGKNDCTASTCQINGGGH